MVRPLLLKLLNPDYSIQATAASRIVLSLRRGQPRANAIDQLFPEKPFSLRLPPFSLSLLFFLSSILFPPSAGVFKRVYLAATRRSITHRVFPPSGRRAFFERHLASTDRERSREANARAFRTTACQAAISFDGFRNTFAARIIARLSIQAMPDESRVYESRVYTRRCASVRSV